MQKDEALILLRMVECRTDLSGLLQYIHNRICNVSRIDFVNEIKLNNKLIVEFLKRLDASNTTALQTVHDATGSSNSNEVTLKINSDPVSITESIYGICA